MPLSNCLSLLFIVFFLIRPLASAQTWQAQESGAVESLRGVSVVDRMTVWASGAHGTVLHTADGGAHWSRVPVPGTELLDFRGIHAFDALHIILMSSGEGDASTLYSTADGGRTWKLLFHNPDGKGFFDALAFSDARHGVLLGDPVNGAFALFFTADSGASWQRVALPPALATEGAFAASNGSVAIRNCARKSHCEISFATGGPGAARVFHTADKVHWKVDKTPLRNDGSGAGIFALATDNRHRGVAVGGNYEKPNDRTGNIARTAKLQPKASSVWTAPHGTPPRGYRSSVVYLEDRKLWITAGPSGSEWSRDEGKTWSPLDDNSFNAVGGNQSTSCWAVGAKGRIAHLLLPPES